MKYNFKTNIGKAARLAAIGFVLFSFLFFFSDILNLFKIQPALAAAAYKGSGSFTAGIGTCTPPMPTGGAAPAANDILLLAVSSENQAISLSTANGFAEVPTWSPQFAGTAGVNPASRLAVFWKRAVGGDASPVVADSGDNTECQIHNFGGIITSGNPWDTGAGGNDGAANDTTGTIPGATTTVTNTLIALFISSSYNGSSTAQCSGWTNANLTNLTERTDNTNTAGLGGGHCLATGDKSATGAYTTTTVTMANTTYKGAISLALKPQNTATLATGSDPAANTIAPGASATDVDQFTLQTDNDTETITSVIVNLSTNSGVGVLAITDNSNNVLGSTSSPATGSNTISVSGMSATTTLTTFKVRVTPLSHAAMPAPPGGAYAITASVTSWVGSGGYTHAGSDTNPNALTIDNNSPAGTTGLAATSGENGQSVVSWTNPADADFQQVYIYCKTSSMTSGEAPAEGTDPAAGSTCDGTARLRYKGTASPQTITGLTNGTTYYFRVYGRDTNGNFTAYLATQEVSATPAANQPPVLVIDNPPAGNTNVAEGANYSIQYDLSDPDSVATVNFYYDTNSDGVGGTAIAACQNQAEGTNVTCSFSTNILSVSIPYYIYGVASDGVNPNVITVSSGTITVNAAPTLIVSQPDGVGDTVNVGDLYNIVYSLADSDNVVTVAMYYDTDAIGLNGTAITGACAAAGEGSGVSCSWNTTGMTPGSYYVYGITNDGVNPQVSDYSPGQITINVALPGAPGTPTFSNIGATSLRINWTAASGAVSYKVERCSGSGCINFSQIASGVTTLYYDDSLLSVNTVYRYQVRGTNAGGDGPYSGIGTSLTLPGTPGTPAFSNVGETSLRVNWTVPTGGADSYKVERCSGSGCINFSQIASGVTTLYYDDSLLSVNTVYRYQVRANNASGDGPYSGIGISLTLPGTPGTPAFSNVGETSLRVNWTVPTGGADSYKVERCSGSGCVSFSQIASGVTNLYYDDSGLSANTVYRYQVRANNASGDGPYSGIGISLTLPGAPGAPTFSNVGETSLTVNWTTPTGGADSYKVERCQGSGCTNFSQIASGVTTLYYDDSGLSSNTVYRYQVRATNASGDGAYSGIGSVTTSPTPVITVSADGTQASSMIIPSTNNYIGGAFTLQRSAGSTTVTQITVTETGSVNAQTNLSNVKLYYETTGTCSYDGGEPQFGATTSFNGSAKATFTGSMTVGASQVCVYVVLDVGSGAADGETLEIEISNPSTEIIASAGNVAPATSVAISGTTTLNTIPVVTVGAAGNQISPFIIPSTNNYIGGAFTLQRSAGSTTVTQITVTETGSVNAQTNLSNVKLYYETTGTCSYDGGEPQFGATTSFNGSAKATFTGSMTVGASQVCVYVVLDVGSGAADGETLEIEITNPSTEIIASAGNVAPATSVAISGTTTLLVKPAVTSVSPNNGKLAGGTNVTIAGTGFLSGASVTFGGSAASNTVVVSGNSITATTPAHSAGAVDVVVTNTNGQSGTLTGGYTYNPSPTVSGVDPSAGPIGGNTNVTITGTGFLSGASVLFGGTSATNIVVVSNTSITAKTPSHAAGAVDVVVTNADTQSGTLMNGFSYTAGPVITSISPDSGKLAGGTNVTITGGNFQTGATITFDATPATNIVVVSSTSITATTPSHAAGAVNVTVTNPDSQSHTLTGGYTYNPFPTVTSVNPSSGSTSGDNVTITGTGFIAGASVTFGGSAATNVSVVSNTSITATAPAHAVGTVDVVVTNPDTQSGTLVNGFSYVGPPVVNLTANPTSIYSGELSVLNWASTDATSCAASGAWSGSKATTGNEIVSPTATSSYTLICDGPGGSAQVSVSVTVSGEAPPPTTVGGSAGTQFYFGGFAYANGTVLIYDNGIPVARLTTGDNASFSTILRVYTAIKHVYGIVAYDKEKQSSPVKTFPSDVYVSRTAGEILMAPTINLSKRKLSKKEEINVYGYATPKKKIKIEIDGKIEADIAASETGYYNGIIKAEKFSDGGHKIRVKQINEAGKESDYSILKLFNIGELVAANADLNGDNILNISDWSIFLSCWASKKAEIRAKIDLNGDGKIDISDLSIFLNAFSKKRK